MIIDTEKAAPIWAKIWRMWEYHTSMIYDNYHNKAVALANKNNLIVEVQVRGFRLGKYKIEKVSGDSVYEPPFDPKDDIFEVSRGYETAFIVSPAHLEICDKAITTMFFLEHSECFDQQ